MEKVFDRVIIVMFENQYRSYVMQDPFMEKLAAAGCSMNNYFGAFHPSQTNYLASLAGEICNVTNDTPPASPLMQETLANLMQPGDSDPLVTWKAYMEAYPNEKWNPNWVNPTNTEPPINQYPNDGINLSRYYRKHNAFASYYDIQSVESKWNSIVDEFTFWKDVYSGNLPEYSWFTPDIWNDGHYLYNTHVDTNPRLPLVTQLSGWLEYVFLGTIPSASVMGGTNFGENTIGLQLDVDLLLTDPKKAYANSKIPAGTLVVVTWDEADYDAKGYDTNYDGQNQIYTVLLGDMIEPGSSIDTPYNHYSLMKTVENNFNIGNLNKNDKGANWFRFLWDKKFSWSETRPTGISANGQVATSYFNEKHYVLYYDADNNVLSSTFDGKQWALATKTGIQAAGSLALATSKTELVLAFTDTAGALQSATCDSSGTWSAPVNLNETAVDSLAMTSYEDYHANDQKLMLAWRSKETDYIFARIYENGAWQETNLSVGQLTDGSITASSLGASVYLVYKERNSFKMRMTSFNTGDFNAVSAQNFNDDPAPDNNTSMYEWSPNDYLVGHFSKKENHHQDTYLANSPLAMASIEGEMHLFYRQRYTDTPQASSTLFGLTGIMTASSEKSNGFGTLAQAGWTPEVAHDTITLDPESANAMTSNGEQLLVVYQQAGGTELYFMMGGYK
jgi:hypothetical protein